MFRPITQLPFRIYRLLLLGQELTKRSLSSTVMGANTTYNVLASSISLICLNFVVSLYSRLFNLEKLKVNFEIYIAVLKTTTFI